VGQRRGSSWLILAAMAAGVAWLSFFAFGSAAVGINVERLDPALDLIVPAQPILERVANGPGPQPGKLQRRFQWTEGPVWIPGSSLSRVEAVFSSRHRSSLRETGYLLFAEIPSNSIQKWTPGKGVSIFMQPSGYKGTEPFAGPEPGSNGMTLDSRGRLTVAGHAQRDVWRLEHLDPKAQVTVLADTYEGKRLNSPNDLTYKSDGSLYFTDPPYGLPGLEKNPDKELPFAGVYRIRDAEAQKPGAPPDHAKLQLLVTDLPRPNGIAFSPDEKYLYVDNSESQKIWMRYTVQADGTLADGKVLFDASSDPRPGGPDGMKVDEKGNIYSAGPGGVWIFSPEGKHLGTLDMPERVGNVAWGGADHKSLYIAASSTIYRIKLKVAGILPH
jgi:gluconolactonase